MSLSLLGLGTALPDHRATQAEALDLALRLTDPDAEQRRLLPVLYRRAGVRTRHVLLDPSDGTPLVPIDGAPPGTAARMRAYEESAGPLAAQAARRALQQAGWRGTEPTHLVTVSCTGASAPGLDLELIDRLALRPDVQRTHVGFMGCHGALAGLRVARALAEAEPGAGVLLVAAELCSLHFHHGRHPDRLVANALFSDGAAAWCGRAGPATGAAGRANGPSVTTDAVARDWSLVASTSRLLPDSRDLMSWRIGSHGFEMTLDARVPDVIAAHLPDWLGNWLAGRGLSPGEVGSWCVHPGGPRILSAVEDCLALPPEALATSREVLAECGNMSSPTVLFVLERLRARRAPGPTVALAFGPGLVAEAALLD